MPSVSGRDTPVPPRQWRWPAADASRPAAPSAAACAAAAGPSHRRRGGPRGDPGDLGTDLDVWWILRTVDDCTVRHGENIHENEIELQWDGENIHENIHELQENQNIGGWATWQYSKGPFASPQRHPPELWFHSDESGLKSVNLWVKAYKAYKTWPGSS